MPGTARQCLRERALSALLSFELCVACYRTTTRTPGLTRFAHFGLQESVKTRHAQLLYESKLYKILQGGGERTVWGDAAGNDFPGP